MDELLARVNATKGHGMSAAKRQYAKRQYYLTPEERFWDKVEKTDTCWNWTAALVGSDNPKYRNIGGYGAFGFNGKVVRAHRFSYELAFGLIPKGLVVLHSCDNKKCVKPEHLSVGTQMDNVADMDTKGRRINSNSNKTHCLHGHEYSEDNVYYNNRGHRNCVTCLKLRSL